MVAKRRWLTREIVVETAASMADEAGAVEPVTMAAVAGKLNVRPPSLYNHVDGLDDLRCEMSLYAMRDLVQTVQSATVGQVGREALMTAATAYRQFAQTHPGIYSLTIRAPDPDEVEMANLAQALLQTLLLMLASLGLQGEDALHAVRGLRALLHGFVSLEVAQGFKMPLARDESFKHVVVSYIYGLTARPGPVTDDNVSRVS